MDGPKGAERKEHRAEEHDVEPASRDVEQRCERRQQQRRHSEVALHHENRHRRAPAHEEGAEIFEVRAQRPQARVCNDVRRLGEIRRQEEDDKELDELDRLVLNRPEPIQRRAPLISSPNASNNAKSASDATTHKYLKAAKRRNCPKTGPTGDCEHERNEIQSCWRAANAGDSRDTIARPSAESTTASAGKTSSRTIAEGCQSTHATASAASSASIHGGPIVLTERNRESARRRQMLRASARCVLR